MDRLPQDALVGILSRLAPRSLSASRCVCKEWCVTIDARCKLRADLLPLSLGGIFVSLSREPAPPAFFARPSMARRIAGSLEDYVGMEDPDDLAYIQDSCNGLILLYGPCVVNPATRQWARLPPYPPSPDGMEGIYDHSRDIYLVFNPAVSQHYEVLELPYVSRFFEFKGSLMPGTEWPPSPCIIFVFSSRTGRWEQRSFIREGEPAATIAHVKSCWERFESRHAVYWRQTLYVHCKSDFLMRLRLSDDKYEVVKLPMGTVGNMYDHFYLGQSKNGVYLAQVGTNPCRLNIWFLNEFGSSREWVLKNSINLLALRKHNRENHDDGTNDEHWILQHGNYDLENTEGPLVQKSVDWNSDNDNALDIENWDLETFCAFKTFGFHPYKEIIFLHLDRRVIAYHFNSSKYQDLGMLDDNCNCDSIKTGFTYTPCWIGELSENM